MNFSIDISLKFVPKGRISNIIIGSDNGLVPTRRQAIIWTNDDKFTDACMRTWPQWVNLLSADWF